MRGIYVNEKATPGMSNQRVRRDLRKYLRKRPSWVVFNELGKHRRYMRQLRRVFDRDQWHHIKRGRNVVTLDRDKYDVLSVRRVKLTRGLVGVNPRRDLLLVRVRHRRNGRCWTIAVTHWTNGAWWNRGQRAERWREAAWRRCEDNMREAIADEVAAGWSVIVYGDFNARRIRKPHPDAEWLHNGHRITKGFTVNADGERVTVFREPRATWHIPDRRLATDKPALGVDVNTRRR